MTTTDRSTDNQPGKNDIPMPTAKDEWIAKCALRYMERGALDREVAFDAATSLYDDDECMRDTDPADAADEDMSYWTDDGDLA